MLKVKEIKCVCGLCGRHLVSRWVVRGPDGKPQVPRMKHSGMPVWVEWCPACGYVYGDIRHDGKIHRELVESAAYLRCEGSELKHDMAQRFYRYAMILLAEGKKNIAYDAFLQAAWICSVSGDKTGAMICREKAIKLYDEQLFGGNRDLEIRHIHVLNGAGRFLDAITHYLIFDVDEEELESHADLWDAYVVHDDPSCCRLTDWELDEEK